MRKYNKYNNKKTIVDNITFDSKKEAGYYQELRFRKMAKDIVDFELQPEFILMEGFKKDGHTVRTIKYRADFELIHKDGTREIVDVKGYKTPVFKLKWKLLLGKFRDEEKIKFTLV